MKKYQIISSLVVAVHLLGCGASKGAFEIGKEEAARGNWDAAVAYYKRATSEEPKNIEYRIALRRALVEASRFHAGEARKYLAAENFDKAIRELEKAIEYDPSHELARDDLEELRQQRREQEPAPSSAEHQRHVLASRVAASNPRVVSTSLALFS